MRGSFKITEIAGIPIKVHLTFLLLPFIWREMFPLAIALFMLVTLHELAHSLVAMRFGIKVREITLLPIGGVAQMTTLPKTSYQEFLISLAGPLTNVAIAVIFYYPVKWIAGPDIFFSAFRLTNIAIQVSFGDYLKIMLSLLYWLNIMLAVFNLLPAFPMDGGRILRSLLVKSIGFRRATKVAVNFGYAFSFIFLIAGLQHSLMLMVIAVFIYLGATSEEFQSQVKTTLKQFRVRDILTKEFLTLHENATFQSVLELIFHTRQEDFPVVDQRTGGMVGFITRSDITSGIHQFGINANISAVMRRDIPTVSESTGLDEVQSIMASNEIRALPVIRDGNIIGVITTYDINRVYSMMGQRAKR